MNTDDWAGKLRDRLNASACARLLEKEYEDEREIIRFVGKLAMVDEYGAAKVARCVRISRDGMKEIFFKGVAIGNASSFRFWIEAFSPRVGVNRVAMWCLELLDQCPDRIAACQYFLAAQVSKQKGKCDVYLRLVEVLKERKLIREARIVENPDGSVSFHVI